MSLELIDDDVDGVLIDQADTQCRDSTPTPNATSESAPSSAGTKPKQSSKDAAAERVRAVDLAESATDERPVDSKLDALSIKLPHLPSPFDATYPRSRGGDRWKKICDDGHCMMCELEPGDGKGNVPVLNRVYSQSSRSNSSLKEPPAWAPIQLIHCVCA
jgi:hypothetical protein